MATQIFSTIEDLKSCLSAFKEKEQSIGFVPTMGALHQGHLSLIAKAGSECDIVVASIFVNPTQFNNPDDLKKYPRTVERDLELLGNQGCDVVFIPSVEEMYPTPYKGHWDYGILSSSLEGHFRPGHFDGVLTIVKRFFEIVEPTKAYFGEKDFQQLAHIRRMAREEMPQIAIVGCPTTREEDGLAMSSRNMRLTPEERETALNISRILFEMKDKKADLSPAELEDYGRTQLDLIPGLRLEYLEIVDASTFAPVPDWDELFNPIALVAVYIGDIRLIDNLSLQ